MCLALVAFALSRIAFIVFCNYATPVCVSLCASIGGIQKPSCVWLASINGLTSCKWNHYCVLYCILSLCLPSAEKHRWPFVEHLENGCFNTKTNLESRKELLRNSFIKQGRKYNAWSSAKNVWARSSIFKKKRRTAGDQKKKQRLIVKQAWRAVILLGFIFIHFFIKQTIRRVEQTAEIASLLAHHERFWFMYQFPAR